LRKSTGKVKFGPALHKVVCRRADGGLGFGRPGVRRVACIKRMEKEGLQGPEGSEMHIFRCFIGEKVIQHVIITPAVCQGGHGDVPGSPGMVGGALTEIGE